MLPKSWLSASVASVCETVSVGIVVNPSDYYVSEERGVRAFRSGNVRENKIQDDRWVYLSEEGHAKNKKSALQTGDVLVVRTGFAGTACVVPKHLAGSNCIDVLFARPKPEKLLPEYLSELTNSEVGRRQVFSGQTGLAQKHLNVATYSKMSFGLPQINEQRRIIDILSTWNKAISITELLLANSLRQKKLLAQRMLTGKVRLHGFGGGGLRRETPYGSLPQDWGYRRISEVAVEVSQKLGGGSPYPVLSCTKHQGLVDSLSYFNKQIYSLDTSTYKVVPRGCFVYATNHIDEGSIGHQDLYDFGLVSPMYTAFKVNDDVFDAYLFALLKTEHYRQIFASATNASVDRRGSLRWKDFRNLHIPVPPIAEQKAIANVLALAEREANLLKGQLKLLREEKAALMVQLLTGKRRVRLIDAETEAWV